MTLYDIILEKAETGQKKNFLNFKGKNLVLDQKLDEMQGGGCKPIILIK
jgi:hypothetical protein